MYTNWSGASDYPIWLDTLWSDAAVVHGAFSFRKGGYSQIPFAENNIGLHVGDEEKTVIANRLGCAEVIGGSLNDWVVPEQVHGTRVQVVTDEHRGRGSTSHAETLRGVDGLVTNIPGITLVVMAADCVPVLFYDPVTRSTGAAHSGWKGTVGHICKEVLSVMKAQYGARTEDIQVTLGPSIRQCCYEVNHVVQAPVTQQFGSKPLMRRLHHPNKFMLSLQACIRFDLESAGVPLAQIEDTGVCTSCHTDLLFSHRAEDCRTGRQLGAVCLR